MTRLSNRQYPMLKIFAEADPGFRMSLAEAHQYDQRPFRSMLMQGWINFDGKDFFLTKMGRAAWVEFGGTHIGRKNPDAPLCQYFIGMWGGGKRGKYRTPPQTRTPGLEPDTWEDRSRKAAPAAAAH